VLTLDLLPSHASLLDRSPDFHELARDGFRQDIETRRGATEGADGAGKRGGRGETAEEEIQKRTEREHFSPLDLAPFTSRVKHSACRPRSTSVLQFGVHTEVAASDGDGFRQDIETRRGATEGADVLPSHASLLDRSPDFHELARSLLSPSPKFPTTKHG
jgi:hypothetical protein